MPERNYVVSRWLPLTSLLLTAYSVHTLSVSAKSQISPEWRAYQRFVSALSRYQTRGAFTYLSSQKKVYARFNWQQISADRYRLILTNPIGGTEMDLSVRPGVAKLIDNHGKRYVSDDPEMMIQKLTGMSIPLNDLRQWLLGLPGNATDFTLDSRGNLRTLSYSNNGQCWTVNYRDHLDGTILTLPSNLELRQGDNRIQLKIDIWIL